MDRNQLIIGRKELEAYLCTKRVINQEQKLHIPADPFPIVVPRFYADLIDWNNPDDPLMKMVIPSELEAKFASYELTDPISDIEFSPVPGIIHRHSNRCLLLLTNACAVHCRFCFRKHMLESNSAQIDKCMQYIRTHNELEEVIFTGGDPFVLPDRLLTRLTRTLASMQHLIRIRYHTRTPVVYPARVTDACIRAISSHLQTIVVIHINHPRELTQEFRIAMHMMRTAGIMLLSQSVLMAGINDDPAILSELFTQLVDVGVKPYYLHHLDMVKGTDHLRVSIARGLQLMHDVRSRVSGVCMPEYVIDVPGGKGKIPVAWFHTSDGKRYSATAFDGSTAEYVDHKV